MITIKVCSTSRVLASFPLLGKPSSIVHRNLLLSKLGLSRL